MSATAKMLFKIRIAYFKPSGKFYTEDAFDWTGRYAGPAESPTCNMNDVAAHVRGLRGAGQGSLPGLSGDSDGWDGFILIDCEDGHPVLLLPEN